MITSILFILAGILLILFAWILLITYQADRFGFDSKSFWDWMDLLLVPLVIAFAGFWFTQSQKRVELEISKKEKEADRQLSLDQQRQNTFDTFLEQITDLLLNYNLLGSKKGDQLQSIARAKTLMTFRNLDGVRKGLLLKFLHEAGLIQKDNVIISLAGADLRNIQLSKSIFENICLSHTDLSKANLSESILTKSDVIYANLSGANLQGIFISDSDAYGAKFQNSDLRNSHILKTQMRDADFHEADFQGAKLRVSEFNNSNLSKTRWIESLIVKSSLSYCNFNQAEINNCKILMSDLVRADLSESNLAGSEIKSTNLSYANLNAANLDGVDMSRAGWHDVQPHLSKVLLVNSEDYAPTKITVEQLIRARSIKNVIMPNGENYDTWENEQKMQSSKGPISVSKDGSEAEF